MKRKPRTVGILKSSSSHLRVLGIETDSARGQCWRARVASTNLASKAAALTPAPRNVDVSTVQLVCRSVEQRERLDPRHCIRVVEHERSWVVCLMSWFEFDRWFVASRIVRPNAVTRLSFGAALFRWSRNAASCLLSQAKEGMKGFGRCTAEEEDKRGRKVEPEQTLLLQVGSLASYCAPLSSRGASAIDWWSWGERLAWAYPLCLVSQLGLIRGFGLMNRQRGSKVKNKRSIFWAYE